MKRYRVLSLQLDSRAGWLNAPHEEHWGETEKEAHWKSQESIRDGLVDEFGRLNFDRKEKDFADLGMMPLSIVAFHNNFLAQIRTAFTSCAYYPALTGACALGERILNHLVLLLRDDHKQTPEYKNVYKKKSFDSWDLMIRTISSWGVILPETTASFKKLHGVRNDAIHFHPETDTNDRELALGAIRLLNEVIAHQFPFMGTQPWFIPGSVGESYIRKEWEASPFIQKVYLPICALLGPGHWLVVEPGVFHPRDWTYHEKEITDEEFIQMRKDHHARPLDQQKPAP